MRIWISNRARRRARREKSSSGEITVGEGAAAGRLVAAGPAFAGPEASRAASRAAIVMKATSATQFTAKARGSKERGQKDRW
jgi:hypothetical protein